MELSILAWNVDTQYDFIYNDDVYQGKLAVANAVTIVPKLKKLTNLWQKHNIRVLNSADWHSENSIEFAENPNYIDTYPKHCIKNTIGAQFIPETKPDNPYVISLDAKDIDVAKIKTTRNLVLYKDAFDIFCQANGNPFVEKIIQLLCPQYIFVYGLASNVCVNYALNGVKNYVKDNNLSIEVYVIIDAIKELPNSNVEELHNSWLETGVKLITYSELKNKVELIVLY